MEADASRLDEPSQEWGGDAEAFDGLAQGDEGPAHRMRWHGDRLFIGSFPIGTVGAQPVAPVGLRLARDASTVGCERRRDQAPACEGEQARRGPHGATVDADAEMQVVRTGPVSVAGAALAAAETIAARVPRIDNTSTILIADDRPVADLAARAFDSAAHHESVDVGGVEAYVLADLVEWDASFIDEAAHEANVDSEPCGGLADIDERRAGRAHWRIGLSLHGRAIRAVEHRLNRC